MDFINTASKYNNIKANKKILKYMICLVRAIFYFAMI